MSLIGSCKIIMKEKTPLSHEVACFHVLDFETSNSKLDVSKSISWKITSFSKTMSLQRDPFLTINNVLYHQPLPITCYQVRFYAYNYFEYLPIVSTAFKQIVRVIRVHRPLSSENKLTHSQRAIQCAAHSSKPKK